MDQKPNKFDPLLANLREQSNAITTRTITYAGGTIWLLYIKQLVDLVALSQSVVKPLMRYVAGSFPRPRARRAVETIIHAADCWVEIEAKGIEGHILNGMVVILFSQDEHYVVVNLKQVQHRSVATPEIHYSIRGPKDSFVENLDVNLSLIRSRLKDPNLKIDIVSLGRRTKTSMAVLYIQDIANDGTVSEVKRRLQRIDTDAVWGTGDIPNFLASSKFSLFPQMGVMERADGVCEALVEGRIVLVADGGQVALIAPYTFGDSLTACDDRNDSKFFGLFSRVLRFAAYLLTLCLSSVYVALVAYHTDALPGNYAIMLAQMRQSVLFSATIEVFIVEFISELIREALLRVPSKIGTAIGIVGAIIIGDAATTAGIFDSLVLIIVSSSLLASFAIPDYFSMHPVRILKFFMIGMTSVMGFYGFAVAFCFILSNLVSIESFGVPYFAPFAPFNSYDFKRAFLFSRSTTKYRPQHLRTKDDTRAP